MEATRRNPENLSNIVEQNAYAVRAFDRRLQDIQERIDRIAGPTGENFPSMPDGPSRAGPATPFTTQLPAVADAARELGRQARSSPGEGPARAPAVDVTDLTEGFVVRIDLPGIEAEDLDVVVGPDAVEVVAASDGAVEGTVLVGERLGATYHRSIPLPAEIAVEDAEADLEDGVLTISLPKVEPGQSSRKLNVE